MIADHTRERYVADETLRLAFERSVQIIGEAAGRLPEDVRKEAPEVAWRELRQMRNFLVHVYFGVDPGILWDNAVAEIPPLHATVTRLIADLEAEVEIEEEADGPPDPEQE